MLGHFRRTAPLRRWRRVKPGRTVENRGQAFIDGTMQRIASDPIAVLQTDHPAFVAVPFPNRHVVFSEPRVIVEGCELSPVTTVQVYERRSYARKDVLVEGLLVTPDRSGNGAIAETTQIEHCEIRIE